MKNIFKTLLLLVTGATLLYACKKDENQVVFEGGTEPVLTASSTTLPLSFVNQALNAVTLSWTNPDYKFNTGLSSQDVTYTIQIDTVGANFTNPKKQTVTVANDLSKAFTQGEFNDYLLNQLELKPGQPHNIEIRVISTLLNNTVPLISNKLSFTVTPYAIPPKVTPPGTPLGNPPTDWINGQLYLIGSATQGGWNNPVPEPAQKFTRISSTLYEITAQLNANEFYLFLPVNGSWSAKYGANGGNGSNNVNGDDFKAEGGDMKAPPANGNYKIVVDFQRGKFTVTKL